MIATPRRPLWGEVYGRDAIRERVMERGEWLLLACCVFAGNPIVVIDFYMV